MHPLFLGNWKMHFSSEGVESFVSSFAQLYRPRSDGKPDVGIAPAFTLIATLLKSIASVAELRLGSGPRPKIWVGAQNVHWAESGAHTGEISPTMLTSLGVDFCIIGHSERRQFYGENNQAVSQRAQAAVRHGLTAVVCVGETKEQREAHQTEAVIRDQLANSLANFPSTETARLIIAYEPVWAIGTGLAATPDSARIVHSKLRLQLGEMFGPRGATIPLLYGGSTSPENIGELLSQDNINGALIGGASLKPEVFWNLVESGRKAVLGS